jgi:hypothetical protein
MTLEEVYFVSQTISAVAIVASLFYVILQVREMHRNQRALIQQGRAFRNTTFTLRQTEAEMAELLTKATSDTGWATINDVELTKLIGWVRGLVFHFEDSYLQHRAGLMDDRAYAAAKSSIATILSRPALRATWELTRSFHAKEFAEVIDALNRETPLTSRDLGSLNAQWKSMVGELTAARGSPGGQAT